MKLKLSLAVLALAAMASSASATKLVVLAVNSGNDVTVPYANNLPPNIGPGTKGFLIGVDLEDNQVDVPLGVQDIHFLNVVHQQGILDENGDPYLDPPLPDPGGVPTPLNLVTRSVASLQQVYDAVAANGLLRSDSYVIDTTQQGGFVWSPVGTGFEGGSAGDTFFKLTGSLGIPSNIDGPGPVLLAYIVTTGDVPIISGVLARGAVGFDALGQPVGTPGQIVLDFETGQIVRIPEPSTLVLAALGLVGLGVGAWRRRK